MIVTALLLVAAMSASKAEPTTVEASPPDRMNELFNAGDYARALQAAKAFLKRNSGSAEAHAIAGSALLRLQRSDEAEEHLRRALELAPKMSGLHYQLGVIYLDRADTRGDHDLRGRRRSLYQEASEEFAKELEIKPRPPEAIEASAIAVPGAGQIGAALAAHEAWLAATPKGPERLRPLVSLAATYAAAGRWSDAVGVLDRVPGEDARLAGGAGYEILKILYHKKRYEDARPLLERLLELEKDSPRGRGLLAIKASDDGRILEALRFLVEYLDLGPPPEESRFIIDSVEVWKRAPSDEALHTAAEQAGITPPEAVRIVPPTYPEGMRQPRIEGHVLILALIGEDGSVERAHVLSKRNPPFEKEALAAVRSWTYRPALQKGRPVKFPITIRIEFHLD